MDYNIEKFHSKLEKEKLIFIIRNPKKEHSLKAAQTVWESGKKIVEITLNSDNATDTLQELNSIKPDDCFLGAGTVRNEKDVIKAFSAKASFIVSPVYSKKIIEKCKELGLYSIIGAYTPTEILNAFESGADLIKVFPASTPKYISYLKGPLNDIPMMAVGGVNIDNMHNYFKSGAFAVALGGSFFEFNHDGSFDKLKLINKIKALF